MKLASVVAVLAVASPSLADSATTTAETAQMAKKDRERLGKSTKHGPVPRIGAKPVVLLNLYNTWTDEWLAFDPASPPTATTVDRFLRDHYTNHSMKMDGKLLGTLIAAAKNFHSDVVDIVSGFRHPKYNLMLRKKGHQVARDSQHSHGNAVDFFIPTITTQQLHAWAKAQHLGGVGLYLESHFVHVDTAAIRYWSGD
ncbi:MAG: hypothetical protein JWO36_5212 [Myxococcales bacterium]|nr:hypothetical protein [Myxococcales bacterium]